MPNDSSTFDLTLRREKYIGRIEAYRSYLLTLARTHMGRQLRRRVNASDIVQDAVLNAWDRFEQFRGRSESEFVAWVRRIVMRVILRTAERELLAVRRDVRREVSLQEWIMELQGASDIQLSALMCRDTSPSRAADRSDAAAELARHLAQLPTNYQTLIVRRVLLSHPFAEIAKDLGMKPGATRAMCYRALSRLQAIVQRES